MLSSFFITLGIQAYLFPKQNIKYTVFYLAGIALINLSALYGSRRVLYTNKESHLDLLKLKIRKKD